MVRKVEGGIMSASQLPPQLETALRALYYDFEESEGAWAGKSGMPLALLNMLLWWLTWSRASCAGLLPL
jgi:hypothetical protein